MEKKTIVLLVSLALIGLFLSEINSIVGEAKRPNCVDPDGADFYTFTTTTLRTKGKTRSGWDYCDLNTGNLIELVCSGDNLYGMTIDCSQQREGYICQNGACVPGA